MFQETMELVQLLGIDPGRLRLEWISSAEGTKFAEVAREFTDQLKALGPSHLRQAA
jgi:F420-non-reducing hydrogenase iron-sulfur subunit